MHFVDCISDHFKPHFYSGNLPPCGNQAMTRFLQTSAHYLQLNLQESELAELLRDKPIVRKTREIQ